MNKEHVISGELIDIAQVEISKGKEWVAYNTILYFLEKSDIYFFKNNDEATEFSDNNISEFDDYQVINVKSLQDFLLQIPYEKPTANRLTNFSNKNLSIMNEKNYDYLKDQLKYTGFGEGLQNDLKEKMEKQTPEFQLNHTQNFGKDEISSTLHFKKSNESEMYFFNKYDAELKAEKEGAAMQQAFYINKESNITLKEAYNLMNGRAVHKELTNKDDEKYKAWLQLDFKTVDKNGNFEVKKFHQNYGFDLEQSLVKYPIKELANDVDKGRLIESLQRGNRQSATLLNEGKEQKIYLEAAPQFKSLNLYDSNMKRVNTQTLSEKQEETQSEKQEAKKETLKKDKAGDDDGEGPQHSQKRPRKKSQSIS